MLKWICRKCGKVVWCSRKCECGNTLDENNATSVYVRKAVRSNAGKSKKMLA